jgi:glycosyltransferase involved in cell wall biosynthesis
MRVLAVTTFNDRSEVAIFCGLVNKGVELQVICHPSAPECRSLTEAGVPVIKMTMRHRLDLKAVRILRKHLKDNGYDIVYAPRNSTLSVSLLASRGMNIKIIAYRGTIGHLSRLDPASWLTYLHPRVDRIVCVSEAVRKYLLSMRLPPSRLTTIHKGHNVDWYSGDSTPGLAEFGIPENAFVVGFAGNIRPVKGVDVLLRSAHLLPQSSDIHFLLVGEVRQKKIEELARDAGIRDRIHFTGFRKDAPALMEACDLFVMPSLEREGLPRALLEAMALGLPAVVTDVGGMPEVIVDNENGLIVPPSDPQALAEAIECLAHDPKRCAELGEHARERVVTHFNINTTIEQTMALYEDVLAGPEPTK